MPIQIQQEAREAEQNNKPSRLPPSKPHVSAAPSAPDTGRPTLQRLMFPSKVQPAVVTKVLPALLLLSTLMGPCQGQADGSWKSCEEGLISIVGVDVPAKVSAGSDATFTLQAESGSEVPGGRLEVAVRYQGVHVYSKSGSLCESVACPVPEGKSTLVMKEKMPHFAPPGAYTMRLEAHNDGAYLFCIEVDFSIGFGRNPVAMLGSVFGKH